MKKIMFNDKYGLTKAVFEGRKTQTRRILNPTILFAAKLAVGCADTLINKLKESKGG